MNSINLHSKQKHLELDNFEAFNKLKKDELTETVEIPIFFTETNLNISENELQKGRKHLEKKITYPTENQLDEKLFAHIHGDAFIGNVKELEGNAFTNTISHLIGYLDHFHPKHENFNKIKANLAQGLRESLAATTQDAINAKAQELTHQILKLGPQESLTMTGGYKTSDGGHAMLYQFNGDDFIVFNSGDGLQYHSSLGDDGKIKYSPVLTYRNFPKDPEKLELFLRTLLECRYTSNLPERDAEFDGAYLYEQVFPTLGAIPQTDPETGDDFITDQTAGTCAEKVLHAFIRKNLPLDNINGESYPTEYKRFQLEYKRNTLVAFYQNKEDAIAENETVRLLLQRSTTTYSDWLFKLHKLRVIDNHELQEEHALLAALTEAIGKKCAEAKAKAKDQAVLQTAKEQKIELRSYQKDFKNYGKIEENLPQAMDDPLFGNHTPMENPLPAIPAYKEIKNYAELKTQLTESLNFFQGLEPKGLLESVDLDEVVRARHIQIHFDNLIHNLPVPSGDEESLNFWNQITPNQAEELLPLLKEIAQMALTASGKIKSAENKWTPLTSLLSHYQLITITHKLASLDPKSHLQGCAVKIKELDALLASKWMMVASLEQQKKWSEIAAYLEKPHKTSFEAINFNKHLREVIKLKDTKTEKDLVFFSHFLPKDASLEDYAKAYVDLEGNIVAKSFATFRHQLLAAIFLTMETGCDNQRSSANKITTYIEKQGMGYKPYCEVMTSYLKESNEPSWGIAAFGRDEFFHHFHPILKDKIVPGPGGYSEQVIKENNNSLECRLKHTLDPYTLDSYVAWDNRATYNGITLLKDISEEWMIEKKLTQELLTVFVEKQRSPLEIVAFFNRHPELLEKEAYQAVLEIVLLGQGNLEAYLKQDPHFIHVLAQVIQENREKAIIRKDIKAELFYLRLASFSQECCIHFTPEEKTVFPNRIQELQKLLKNPSNHPSKGLIARHLVEGIGALPAEDLKKDIDLIEVLIKARCLQAAFEEHGANDIAWQYECEKNYAGKLNLIHGYLIQNSNQLNKLGNGLIAAITENLPNLEWKLDASGQKLQTTSTKDLWEISLVTGKIWHQGESLSGISKELYESAAFKELFENTPHRIIPETRGRLRIVYQNQDKQEESAYVCIDNGKFRIQKQIQGIWSEFCFPFNKKELLPSKALSDDRQHHYWISCDKVYKEGALLITDRNARLQCIAELKDNSIATITTEAMPTLRGQEGNFELVDIYKEKENKPWWLNSLAQFEDLQWIEVWRKKGQNNDENTIIHLPRFNLQFELKDEKGTLRVICVQAPDFYLQSPAAWLGPKPHDKGLLLQHKEKSDLLKVCLPFQKIAGKEKLTPLSTDINLKYSHKKGANSQQYLLLDLTSTQRLKATTPEEHLYLAYLYLTKGHDPHWLKLAKSEIMQAWTLKEFSTNASQTLKWIFKSHDVMANRDSQLVGLLLKLAAMIYHNTLQNSPDNLETNFPEALKVAISRLYSRYMKGCNRNPLSKLSQAEELAIINLIKQFQPNSLPGLIRQFNSHLQTEMKAQPAFVIKAEIPNHLFKNSEIISMTNFEDWLHPDFVKKLPMATIEKDVLLRAFPTFLNWAVKGTPQEKEELKVRLTTLRLSKEHQSTECHLVAILKKALEQPDLFSSTLAKIPAKMDYYSSKNVKEFLASLPYSSPLPNASEKVDSDETFLKKGLKEVFPSYQVDQASSQVFKLSGLLSPIQPFEKEFLIEKPIAMQEENFVAPLTNFEGEKHIQHWVKDIQEDFSKRIEQKEKTTWLLKEDKLPALKKQLQEQVAKSDEELKKAETMILNAINCSPDSLIERIHTSLMRFKGEKKIFHIN